jgi:hypothetical protein
MTPVPPYNSTLKSPSSAKAVHVIKTDNATYKLDFFFARGNFVIQCVIHLSSDEFWIEPIDGISLFPTGEDELYRNLSRPPIKPTHKTTDNLRLRRNPDILAPIGYADVPSTMCEPKSTDDKKPDWCGGK